MEMNSPTGWIINLPFVTNQRVQRVSTLEDLLQQADKEHVNKNNTIPYSMLQPEMRSRLEAKLVCFGGNPLYISIWKKGGGSNSHKQSDFGTLPDYPQLFQFASDAITKVKQNCNGFMWDGLVRVDIFLDANRKLRVNELESLDADYETRIEKCGNKVNELLQQYWTDAVRHIFEQLVG